MKKTYQLLYLLLFPLLMFSCSRKSEIITQEMSLQNFTTLELRGVYDVYLIQDTVCSIRITGPERVVEKMDVIVDTGALTVVNRHSGKFLRPNEETVRIYIHVDTLKRINISESCHIYTENPLGKPGQEIGVVSATRLAELDLELACGTFYFWNHPNAVKMNLRGRVDVLKLWNVGLSRIDASQLTADYVICDNGSSSDCYVKAMQKLEYKISNKGNIYYSGTTVQGIFGSSTENASGKLISVP